MIVTIWRHAEAGSAVTDKSRALTDRGIDDMGFACTQFHAHCCDRKIIPPSIILYSEWLRTEQTAAILNTAFNNTTPRKCDALIPGRGVEEIDSELQQFAQDDEEPVHVILVSHQPLVSNLIAFYLGDNRVAPLQPGGFATLYLDIPMEGIGVLLFSAQRPNFEALH